MIEQTIPLLADSQIMGWHGTRGYLTVEFVDRQENRIDIRFDDFLAVSAISPVGEDLSHMESVDEVDPDIVVVSRSSPLENEEFRTFRLVSAWSGRALMTVVARTFSVRTP